MFGQKPKPPLIMAIGLVNDAMDVAYAHLRNTEHLSTEEQLEQLDILAALLLVNGEITKYIHRSMQKRMKV